MSTSLDTPEIRKLLGLAPHPTVCDCCKIALLPVGTRVRTELFGKGYVASWCKQDHWNVPVNFDAGNHALIARNGLTLLKDKHGTR